VQERSESVNVRSARDVTRTHKMSERGFFCFVYIYIYKLVGGCQLSPRICVVCDGVVMQWRGSGLKNVIVVTKLKHVIALTKLKHAIALTKLERVIALIKPRHVLSVN
jgi:hypothetical protein